MCIRDRVKSGSLNLVFMIFFVWELKPLSYLHFLGALVNFAWAKINVVNLIKCFSPLFSMTAG